MPRRKSPLVRALLGASATALLVFLVVTGSFLFVPRTFVPPGDAPSEVTVVIDPNPPESLDAFVAEFYERIGEPEEKAWGYSHTGFRADAYEIAYAVLRGLEPHQTLVKLLTHPDQDVRIESVFALGDAQNVLGQDGYGALLRLWKKVDADVLVPALCEALIHSTVQGIHDGHGSWLLASMGEEAAAAREALIWTSDHNTEPDVRVFAMNNAHRVDPTHPDIAALFKRRLADPSPHVRQNALQGVFFHKLEDLLISD